MREIRHGVLVRSHLLAEDRQPRVAVAFLYISENLIVSAVFLDDVDDVLNRRAGAHFTGNH